MTDARKLGIRKKLRAKSDRPRLSVYRSNAYIYAQVIDDAKGVTIAAARGTKPEEVGTAVAKACIKAGVKTVVFDRGDYRYHGRVKTLATAARNSGLDF